MYSDVVMELGKSYFEERIDAMKGARASSRTLELDAERPEGTGLASSRQIYLEIRARTSPGPQRAADGRCQGRVPLLGQPRANVYRRDERDPLRLGHRRQRAVHGLRQLRYAIPAPALPSPVTPPPAKKLMGEYLINAQGEDVVAGIRTPSPISKLHEEMPEVYDQFVEIATRLENYYKDMQDMEFTIEDGKLFMLQTRNGKRTAQAALKIACDLVDEGIIDEKTAVLRVEPKQLDTLLHPQFDAAALKAAEAIGKGLAASPGSACGRVVFSAEDGGRKVKDDAWKKVVLVRLETSPRGYRRYAGLSGHPDRPRRYDQPRCCCGPRHGHLLRLRLRQ